MLTFTIYGKSFKELMEKAMTIANNKAPISSLRRIYFKIQNGILHVFATNIEHSIDVVSPDAFGIIDDGEFAMEIEEAKLIAKMTDNITITETTEEGSETRQVTVKCGKKQLTVTVYNNYDNLELPGLNDFMENIMVCRETWLLETIANLDKFTCDSDTPNKMMSCININTEREYFEALDGHRITTRKISGIVNTKKERDLLLSNMATPVIKKVMSKKSKLDVNISCDNKYIQIQGKDFTYIQNRFEGMYFDTKPIMNIDCNFSFDVETENLLEVTKYASDIVKGLDRLKPLCFHSENGKVYTYCVVPKYEVFDELETDNVSMSEDIYIGFNPNFFVEALSIAETENVHIVGTNAKASILMEADEYSFLILPVNIDYTNVADNMRKKISRVA